MKSSAAFPKPSSSKPAATVTYFPRRDRRADLGEFSPVHLAWTDELERRRRAVARWRGSDVALKETMLRE